MASVPMPRRYLTVMNLGWGLGALPFVVIGLAESVWVVIAASLVMGEFSFPWSSGGRCSSAGCRRTCSAGSPRSTSSVSVSLMPVSMALAGPVADAIGLRNTFFIAGLVPGVVAVVAVLWGGCPPTRSRTRCATERSSSRADPPNL